jgi:hypothetical protein
MRSSPDNLVAIAAGTSDKVAVWSKLVHAESIMYQIVTPCPESSPEEPGHEELWVHKDDAVRAKSILRQSSSDDDLSLW